MFESTNGLASAVDRGGEVGREIIEKVFAAARREAVFGEPVQADGYTVITVSDITTGGGFGFGGGTGSLPDVPAEAAPSSDRRATSPCGGGGVGAGVTALARPVAAIVVSADGVEVKPIVDVTKIAVAGITAWAAMAVMLVRIDRTRRGGR